MDIEKNAQKSVISKGTVITGNIKTSDDISVYGDIKGNIDAEKDIEISGNTEGDIKADNMKVSSGTIKGNIQLKNKLDIESAEKIEGDITTKQISIKSCGSLISNIKTITD